MREYYFDGQHLKGFNLPMSWDNDLGWEIYGNPVEGDELVARTAAVSRAFELNALAAMSVPFALVDEAGNDWDVSTDWQNRIGFLPNPRKLIRLWRKSISMTNAAYGLIERRGGMRYIMPNTIKPDVDRKKGLVGFWRQIGGQRIYYPVGRELVHLYRMDYDTEILPSDNTEFKSIMESAGLIYYNDIFTKEFFKRGGIKPHLLKVAGMPQKDERERIQSWFDKLMLGLTQFRSKVVNAEAMEAQPIGEGVDSFKDNVFYRQAIENIAMATGIPLSLLLSNSANMATARMEYKNWYDNSVIPMCQMMADELNDNLFRRFGLTMDIRESQTDPDQEDEVRRSTSFVNYAGVLLKNGHPQALSISAQLVGLDMPPDMEYEDLDERDEERMPQQPTALQSEQPEEQDTEEPEDEQEEETKTWTPNAEQITELKTWQDIARRKVGKGQTLTLPLVAKHLPADIAGVINARLEGVTDVAGVRAAFDLTTITAQPEYKSDIIALAEAINRLAEIGEKENG